MTKQGCLWAFVQNLKTRSEKDMCTIIFIPERFAVVQICGNPNPHWQRRDKQRVQCAHNEKKQVNQNVKPKRCRAVAQADRALSLNASFGTPEGTEMLIHTTWRTSADCAKCQPITAENNCTITFIEST